MDRIAELVGPRPVDRPVPERASATATSSRTASPSLDVALIETMQAAAELVGRTSWPAELLAMTSAPRTPAEGGR